MIDNSNIPESESGGLPTTAPGSGEKKAGGRKIPSGKKKKKWIVFVGIVVLLIVGPALWAGYVSLQFSRAPATLPKPHDHEVALSNILELQALPLSEAEAGRPAFFVTYIGCAVPPVWHNVRVLQNFKRMREEGVEVTLTVSEICFLLHNNLP